MPPTTGHLQLVQFASLLAPKGVEVIVCTQPHEPMVRERVQALRDAVGRCHMDNVRVRHFDQVIEQDPRAPGFWETWRSLMVKFGVTTDDYIVASEAYGQHLAELTGAQFFPYDIDRSINSVKATPVREDPIGHFADILPEFQTYLRTTVTVFGAESTGKTTLSRQLAETLHGHWLFEYARPYLERTVNEITVRSMTGIWKGQSALQRQAVQNLYDKPFVIQDTDLFSTVGYWQFPHWQPTIGTCPPALIDEALALKSDLYIITKSNIPFEADPLRYGGTVREGIDEYWIDVCRRYELPFVILEQSDRQQRLTEAVELIQAVAAQKVSRIAYDRHGL